MINDISPTTTTTTALIDQSPSPPLQNTDKKAGIVFQHVFPSGDVFNHAPTIIETDLGLLCMWYRGPAEGKETAIWGSFFHNDTCKWDAPELIIGEKNFRGEKAACWNPVLFTCNKKLFLVYKVGTHPTNWSSYLRHSDDSGKTWSNPVMLRAGIEASTKNPPYLLEDGTLLFPSSSESFNANWACGTQRISCNDLISNNQTGWKGNNLIGGFIQPALFSTKDNKFRMVARPLVLSDSDRKFIGIAESEDAETWSPMRNTTIPNPGSGICAIRDIKHDWIWLVCNPNFRLRNPLKLFISKDDGETWEKMTSLEEVPDEELPNNGKKKYTFAYPYVLQDLTERIHVVYQQAICEYDSEGEEIKCEYSIKHVVLDPKELVQASEETIEAIHNYALASLVTS